MNGLTVIFSTRKKDENYINHLIKTSGLNSKLEVLCYENNGEYSLPYLYNKGLIESKNNIVVFCHDDLDFKMADRWGVRLLNKFNKNPSYGIMGAAGTTELVEACWWVPDLRNAKGIVMHIQKDGRLTTSRYSSENGSKLYDVVTLDGLFIAVDKTKIINNFDEEFNGFHFYDIPFCVNNFVNGVKIGVFTDIRLIHKSIGETNKQWQVNRELFNRKYGKLLPLKIK
jgi:hypothetical protein